jgi:DNA polymerase-3 subunit beta
MRVQVEGGELARAVAQVKRATGRRAVLPVLSGLKIVANGTLEVSGTDLETTIRASLPYKADTDGEAIIDAALLEKVVKANRDRSLGLAGDGNDLVVTTDRGEYRMRGFPTENYPTTPRAEGYALRVNGAVLLDALSRVSVACSDDESRQVLTGVLFELDIDAGQAHLTVAATDSYRLAVHKIPVWGYGAPPTRVVVNGGTLDELCRLLRGYSGVVKVIVQGDEDEGGNVTFSFGGYDVTGTILAGAFPKYRQLIPEGFTNSVTVDVKEAIGAVERVSVLAQNNLPVRLTLGSPMEVSTHTPDVGEARENLRVGSFEGERLLIAFNAPFLIQGLKVCGDVATLEVGDALRPGILRARDGLLYLIMPVRLN